MRDILSFAADVAGLLALVGAVGGFLLGRRELKLQQNMISQINDAVEKAINNVRERIVASSLASTRHLASDFRRCWQDKQWERALFVGELLRTSMQNLLAAGGFNRADNGLLLEAFDEIKLIHDRVRKQPTTVPRQVMQALDKIVDNVDTIYGRKSIPQLVAGASDGQ